MPEPAPTTGTGAGSGEAVSPPPGPVRVTETGGGSPETPDSGGSSTLEKIRLDFLIANRTVDAERKAREMATEQVRQEQKRGSLWSLRDLGRKIKYRALEGHYIREGTKRVMAEMVAQNNSYLTMDVMTGAAVQADANRAEYEEAEKAKVEQLQSGYTLGDDTAADADRRELVADASDAVRSAVISDILQPIVEGTIRNPGQVQDAIRDIIQRNPNDQGLKDIFGENPQLFATDLLYMGERVRQDLARHGKALDDIKHKINVKIAKAQWGAQTELPKTRADKVVEKISGWLGKHESFGRWVNPATVSAVVSAGTWFGMSATRNAARAATAVPIAGTAVGAVFTAARRWREVKFDRATHQIERAYGGQIGPDTDHNVQFPRRSPRREKMEKFIYSMATIDELVDGGGRDIVRGKDRASLQDLMDNVDASNQDSVDDLFSRMAEIESRLDISAQEQRDLISFGGREQVEQGRLELIQSLVHARRALRGVGIDNAAIDAGKSALYTSWSGEIAQDKKSKDKSFLLHKWKEAGKAGLAGGITGLVIGGVVNEVLTEGIHAIPGRITLPGGEVIGDERDTVVTDSERGVRWIMQRLGAWNDNIEQGVDVNAVLDEHNKMIEQIREELADGENIGVPINDGEYFFGIDQTNPKDIHIDILDSSRDPIGESLYDIELLDNGRIEVTGELPDEVKDAIEKSGFKLKEVDTEKVVQELLPKAGSQIESDNTGHKIMIPEGTEWLPDAEDKHGDPLSWKLVFEADKTETLIEGVEFTEEGSLVPDTMHVSKEYASYLDINGGSYQEISGSAAVDRWKEIGTDIDRREWYAYNRAGSQGNELRGYTLRRGDTVILDMSRMQTSIQQGLDPAAIDVQKAIANGANTGFAMKIPGMDGVVFLEDGMDGKVDGMFALDPNDTKNMVTLGNGEKMTVGDFTRMVVDQDYLKNNVPSGGPGQTIDIATEVYDRRELFKLGGGTIEYSMMTEQDGQTVLKTFATIKGEGDPSAIIGDPLNINAVDELKRDLEVPVSEIIPPNRPMPIIPLPMYGRFPMEELVTGVDEKKKEKVKYEEKEKEKYKEKDKETGEIVTRTRRREASRYGLSEEERSRLEEVADASSEGTSTTEELTDLELELKIAMHEEISKVFGRRIEGAYYTTQVDDFIATLKRQDVLDKLSQNEVKSMFRKSIVSLSRISNEDFTKIDVETDARKSAIGRTIESITIESLQELGYNDEMAGKAINTLISLNRTNPDIVDSMKAASEEERRYILVIVLASVNLSHQAREELKGEDDFSLV